MIKLLKYIVIVVVAAFTISTVALYIVNAGLKKQQNDSFYTLNHIFYNNKNYDLLMIGNSRCKNNINPGIVDSVTGISSFNTGNYNFKIIEYKLMLELYLSSGHPKPKYVLLTLDNKVLDTDIEFYFPQQFLPYVNNDIIYNSLKEYANDYFTVRYLPFIGIAKYNDYMKYLSLKGFYKPQPTDPQFYKGFQPMVGGNAGREANKKDADLKPTEKGLRLLDEFFKINEQHNINVFVVLPPFYQNKNEPARLNKDFYIDINVVMSRYNNITVFDMTQLPFNYRKELFFDKGHLNSDGAQQFSLIIADSLQVHLN